jgi:hypothetical protein
MFYDFNGSSLPQTQQKNSTGTNFYQSSGGSRPNYINGNNNNTAAN